MKENLGRYEYKREDDIKFIRRILEELNFYAGDEFKKCFSDIEGFLCEAEDVIRDRTKKLNNFVNAENEQAKIEIMQDYFLEFLSVIPDEDIGDFMSEILGLED